MHFQPQQHGTVSYFRCCIITAQGAHTMCAGADDLDAWMSSLTAPHRKNGTTRRQQEPADEAAAARLTALEQQVCSSEGRRRSCKRRGWKEQKLL